MPEWLDVVGYEEGDKEIRAALQLGYPRFFLHPYYQALRREYQSLAQKDEVAWVFPSLAVAEECVKFSGGGRVQKTNDGVALAFMPKDLDDKAKKFWQHTGLIVSSRQAKNILDGKKSAPPESRQELKTFVASLYGAEAEDVYLSPTGMSAIFQAYNAVVAGRDPKVDQVGFSYGDTLSIVKKFGEGEYLTYNSPDDLVKARTAIARRKIAGVICEVPNNPLLRTIDLENLHRMLKFSGVPLIIDDTLGPPVNVDVYRYADAVVTSLTKFVSGKGNVMGGSLVLNVTSPHYRRLKANLRHHEELLYPDDAEVLLKNGRGFVSRMQTINRNAERLYEFLRKHPAIAQVNFPKGDSAYAALRKQGGGFGGLLSFTLKNPELAPAVYDNLRVAKGPSLGTEFTLACPFTLLMHFDELAWANKEGVASSLIRVSVGTENTDEIIARFEKALNYGLPPAQRHFREQWRPSLKRRHPSESPARKSPKTQAKRPTLQFPAKKARTHAR